MSPQTSRPTQRHQTPPVRPVLGRLDGQTTRCGATATAPFTNICVWCVLPQGHVGRHRGFIPQAECPDATFEWPSSDRPAAPPTSPKGPPMSDRDTLAALIAENRTESGDDLARWLLDHGVRPPAQVIETPEALEALPVNSVVFVDDGRVWQRHPGPGQCWFEPGWTGGYTSTEAMQRAGDARATVVYLPTENGETDA